MSVRTHFRMLNTVDPWAGRMGAESALLGSPDMQEERESGFLFPNDFIVFDEAHTVEQVASKQIGIGVSQYGLRSTIQRLYNARRELPCPAVVDGTLESRM